MSEQSLHKTKPVRKPGRGHLDGKPGDPLFDVTCVVGSIYPDTDGPDVNEAALALIGRHGADGVYNFPREDGGIVTVTVEGLRL